MQESTQKQAVLEKEKTKGKYMLALGFFDCLHVGHRELLANMKMLCKLGGYLPAVFTFDDDFFATLGRDTKNIYTLAERERVIIEELDIPKIVIGTPSKLFMQMDGTQFLEYLEMLDVGAVIAGMDFRFGKNASFGIDELDEWAKATGRICVKQPLKTINNRKISSTDIRDYLDLGMVEFANELLGRDYFIYGKVVHGRGEGKSYGMPTANLEYPENKLLPGEGVYETRVVIDGMPYMGVTNVGSCPTFGVEKATVETHVLDFCGSAYDDEVELSFIRRLRSIIKFESKADLKAQIENDIGRVRGGN